MHLWIISRVEDGQEDQTRGADKGKDDRDDAAHLLRLAVVRRKASGVTQPSLADEDNVERDHHGGTGRDEDGLAPAGGPNIRDIQELLPRVWFDMLILYNPNHITKREGFQMSSTGVSFRHQ